MAVRSNSLGAGARSRPRWATAHRRTSLGVATALLTSLVLTYLAPSTASAVPIGAPTLVQASNDTATTTDGTDVDQNLAHADTDTASNGTTVVSTFSVGHPTDGFGGAAIGFATSTDDGRTWTHGLLQGITDNTTTPGLYPRAVDSSVAWDAKNSKFVITSVAYVPNGGPPPFLERALMVSTSADGLTWSTATRINPPNDTVNADKPWVTCDNTSSSTFYGSCYVAFTERNVPTPTAFTGWVVKSTDGGANWTAPVQIPNGTLADEYNLFPVVQPSGKLVVIGTEVNGDDGADLFSSSSTDGGANFATPSVITTIQRHNPNNTIREQNKPTADVDAAGKITVVWSDCRFSGACDATTGTNQLVMSTSTDGDTFTAPAKVNIPGAAAGNQFGQGLGVAPGTSGSTAQLSLVYYTAGCGTPATCLNASYTTSLDGGTTWSTPYAINSTPMPITNFADNPRGRFAADYTSISFAEGGAVAVLPLALTAPSGGVLSQTAYGLSLPPGFVPTTPPGPPPATPDTKITKHPKKHIVTTRVKVRVKFKYTSTVAGSTFQCKIDKRKWKACGATKVRYKVRAGKHKFQVRATSNGLTDATPAKFRFRVKTV